MNMKNNRKGFTTVELVIVIAVIAILATVLIPTFSNMIESANLSVDKQNVRNMNVCLATESVIEYPSSPAHVKAGLMKYGYGTEDNFAPKSKNHSICWYYDAEENISVILLLNGNRDVVYPENYVDNDVIKTDDFTKCYNLSTPLAGVIPVEDQGDEYFKIAEVEQAIDGIIVDTLLEQYANLDNDVEKNAFKNAYIDVFGTDEVTRSGNLQARRPNVKKTAGQESKEYEEAYERWIQYFGLVKSQKVKEDFTIGDLFSKQLGKIAEEFEAIFVRYAEIKQNTGDKNAAKEEVLDKIRNAFAYALAVKYVFTAEEDSEKYAEWTTTFYVSVKLPEGMKGKKVTMTLAGFYESSEYSDGWQHMNVTIGEGEEKDLLRVFFGEKYKGMPYNYIKDLVSPFTCGVVDLTSLSDKEKIALFDSNSFVLPSGAELTVELRMTNEDTGERQTIGVYKYVFPEMAQIGQS